MDTAVGDVGIDLDEPGDAARPLRRDAVRNRALILETAAQVFAERGLEAGYDEIARRAGVGVGTVYRRFPERSELVQALFESRIEGVVAVGEEALRHPSPWEGLTGFLTRILEQQATDRGLKEVMAMTISEDQHQTVGREQVGPLFEAIVQRAKADGSLRADVEPTDVGILLMQVSSISTPEQPDLWKRYLALLLDALHASPTLTPLPLAAPDDDAIHEIMRSQRHR